MESIIVHAKNQMELNAVKGVLKEMGIKFEKFHTRDAKKSPYAKPEKKWSQKSPQNFKENPKKGQ